MKNHSQFHPQDLSNMMKKGWSPQEVAQAWNSEKQQRLTPTAWPRPDVPHFRPRNQKENKAAWVGARKETKAMKAPTHADLKKHPMYSKEDHEYLQGKGYSPEKIEELWDRDHKLGKGPQAGNKNSPETQAHFAGLRKAMTGASK